MLILACVELSLAFGQSQTLPFAERMQRSAKFYHDRDGFMGVVAVQKDHRLIYQAGYGYANIALQIPFTADTRFPIGSNTKQFTAAAILLLQQDGKLKTSAPLDRYYRNAPASWSAITLRNLLDQTSGIADIDFGRIYKESPRRPEELLRGLSEKPLAFPPGSQFEYANVNYMLLGLVIERVSGRSFCQFLSDRIFRPLRLTETGCDWSAPTVPHRAHGYRPSAKGPVPFEDAELGGLGGAGSLYSSARDLIRWNEAFYGGRLLSKASMTEMTTPHLNGYAYGLEISDEGAELDLSHNGAVEGFFSCLDYIPATKTTVVVLSNLVAEGNQASPGTLAFDTELVRLAINDDSILPSEGREAHVPEEVLRGYAGHYRSDDTDHPQRITVQFQDGRLLIANDGGSALPLRAESSSRFYLATQETEVIFDPHTRDSVEIMNYAPIWGAVYRRVTADRNAAAK